MTPAEIRDAAARLVEAERSRLQTGVLSVAWPGISMDDAYAIQDAFVAAKEAAGAVRRGWKIGLTSRAMQMALGIDIPDSGILFDDMFFDHGGVVPMGRFIEPRIEAEIAFGLKSDLSGANVTRADVMAATDYVAPALEILDTRILRSDPDTGAARKVFDTIADNPCPYSARRRTSQTMPSAGSFRTPAPRPVSSTVPSRDTIAPTQRISNASGA